MSFSRPFVGACWVMLLCQAPALLGCDGGSPDPDRPPNFLVFDIDSLRYDRLDEERRGESPTLHGLADRGVVFEAAYAPSGWTAPALASILVGSFPPLEYVSAGAMHAWAPAIGDVPTLPEVLGYYGYHTAAFWGATSEGILAGSTRGFDHRGAWDHGHGASYDRGVIAWLEDGAEPPFFALVHNMDLHRPSPPKGQGPSGAGREQLPDCVRDHFGPEAVRRRSTQTPEEGLRTLVRRYDCALSYYDQSVARILAALDASGFAQDTVILVTSNHGELLLEHGVLGHELLYEPVLHVPFVVVDPRDPQPRRLSEPVELQDLAPTLLRWAGAVVPREMQGRSLLPLLLQTGPVEPLTDLYALTNRGNAAIRSGGYKLIRADDSLSSGTPLPNPSRVPRRGSWLELYDLEADPDELVDLSGERPELVAELDGRLGAWISPRYLQSERPAQPMDAALERELKERGYWDAVVEPGGAPR